MKQANAIPARDVATGLLMAAYTGRSDVYSNVRSAIPAESWPHVEALLGGPQAAARLDEMTGYAEA